MISILVAAHEYGHYYFARLFGMGVEEFAIGMGKKLKIWRTQQHDIPVSDDYVHDPNALSAGASFEGGSIAKTNSKVIDGPDGRVLRETTEFTVRMLPIGGFVRIKGMIPQDDGSEVKIPGGFYSMAPWKRLVVLLAGPVASVLSGMLILIPLYMFYGSPKLVDKPIVDNLFENSVAAKAGLQPGDVILQINGEPTKGLYSLVHTINESTGKPLHLLYKRGNGLGSTQVIPKEQTVNRIQPDLGQSPEQSQAGTIGIIPKSEVRKLAFAAAIQEAIRGPVDAVQGLIRIIKKPARLKDEAGGAITMIAATQAATEAGPGPTIWLACMLSISVGIFNLLPVPPLDGGQMVMAIAELLRGGKRLSIQVQQTLMNAGVLLVLTLTVVVLFIDVQRFTGGSAKKPLKVVKQAAK
jgi:regulator of sigma E protease